MAGLYIHIPFCKSKCAYCDFPSQPGREGDAGRYFNAVIREAEMMTPPAGDAGIRLDEGDEGWAPLTFTTVFIGGGTPSLLPAGELERLMDGLRAILPIATPVEFTVEANPGTVDREKLESFRRMGADRLSLGVQAAQDALLRRIGRIHTWEDFLRSHELAREAGFSNINADMMTGLPGQTLADAVETAERYALLGLEHVSCYGLILEPGTRLYDDVSARRESIPCDDAEREMFHAAKAVLECAGIRRYEISNFARPGYECKHNLNYWHNGGWLGLGCGAASHFSGYRRENHADLDAYLTALGARHLPPAEEHTISTGESAFETIMLELRLVEGINLFAFERKYGFSFLSKYYKQVEKFINQGLMQKTNFSVSLTEKGMDLQNTVLMDFMD